MPNPWYLVGVLFVGFAITFGLRAIPFTILKPLRESKFVEAMSAWMPAGILAILALTTFAGSASGGSALAALVAVTVTVGVHLLAGRRTLLSVGAGTLTFVLMVNFL